VRDPRVRAEAQQQPHDLRAVLRAGSSPPSEPGFQSVIGVSTKPGLMAVARTPCSCSPRLSVFVNWITAAFAAP
jgi:hypothetical protein